MTLKRYRMEIVLIDTVVHIQARHDAGTGEWYAASEVDQDRADYELRVAVAVKLIDDGELYLSKLVLLEMSVVDLGKLLIEHPEYKPE